MKNISIQGAKGGVGTTTIALAIATILNTRLFSRYNDSDLQAIGADLLPDTSNEFEIWDDGTNSTIKPLSSKEINFLVARNDYLSLTRCMDEARNFDALILLINEGSSIDPIQFANTCGAQNLIVIPVKPDIARCIDAGVFATKKPGEIFEPLTALLNDLKEIA